MSAKKDTVVVLDDDRAFLKSISRLLTALGYHVVTYSRAAAYLKARPVSEPACLVLDMRLEDGNGLQLYSQLKREGRELPTIFLTAYGDMRTAVAAMRHGADDFLMKPHDPDELLAAITRGLEKSRERASGGKEVTELKKRVASLTDREREVVTLVASGFLNKQVADRLNLAVITVKVHRGRAMQKLGAQSAAELARIAQAAGLITSEAGNARNRPAGR